MEDEPGPQWQRCLQSYPQRYHLPTQGRWWLRSSTGHDDKEIWANIWEEHREQVAFVVHTTKPRTRWLDSRCSPLPGSTSGLQGQPCFRSQLGDGKLSTFRVHAACYKEGSSPSRASSKCLIFIKVFSVHWAFSEIHGCPKATSDYFHILALPPCCSNTSNNRCCFDLFFSQAHCFGQPYFKKCCQGEIKPEHILLTLRRAGQHWEGRRPGSERHPLCSSHHALWLCNRIKIWTRRTRELPVKIPGGDYMLPRPLSTKQGCSLKLVLSDWL